MLLRNSLALLAIFASASFAFAQSAPKLEARALKAVGDRDEAALEGIAADIARLKENERRGLRFRVRPEAIEFRFKGQSQGQTYIEFILSNKFRDYESLLVLDETELARLVKLANGINQRKEKPSFEFRLLWSEKNIARSEDLFDVLGKIDFKERRKRQYPSLQWSEEGLRIDNVEVDAVFVPAAKQVAEMLVIVHLNRLGK